MRILSFAFADNGLTQDLALVHEDMGNGTIHIGVPPKIKSVTLVSTKKLFHFHNADVSSITINAPGQDVAFANPGARRTIRGTVTATYKGGASPFDMGTWVISGV